MSRAFAQIRDHLTPVKTSRSLWLDCRRWWDAWKGERCCKSLVLHHQRVKDRQHPHPLLHLSQKGLGWSVCLLKVNETNSIRHDHYTRSTGHQNLQKLLEIKQDWINCLQLGNDPTKLKFSGKLFPANPVSVLWPIFLPWQDIKLGELKTSKTAVETGFTAICLKIQYPSVYLQFKTRSLAHCLDVYLLILISMSHVCNRGIYCVIIRHVRIQEMGSVTVIEYDRRHCWVCM